MFTDGSFTLHELQLLYAFVAFEIISTMWAVFLFAGIGMRCHDI